MSGDEYDADEWLRIDPEDPDFDIEDYYERLYPMREQFIRERQQQQQEEEKDEEPAKWKWVLKDNIKSDNCAICQQKLNNGTLVMELSCSH